MGWWKLEAWKVNNKGDDMDLLETDLDHIAELIKDGYTSGEVVDGDEIDHEEEVADAELSKK